MLDVGHANEAGIMNRRWVGKLYVIETSPNFMLKLFLLQNLNARSRKGTWNSSEMVWPAWSVLIRMWYFIYPWFEKKKNASKNVEKCGLLPCSGGPRLILNGSWKNLFSRSRIVCHPLNVCLFKVQLGMIYGGEHSRYLSQAPQAVPV